MLLVRLDVDGRVRHGRVLPERSREIELLDGDCLHGTPRPTGERLEFEKCMPQLLAPVLPGKIIAVGTNYRDHAIEMGKPIPEEPLLFLKPPSALLDPGRPIVRPLGYQRVDYEGELAVVIGRRASRIRPAEAAAHVLGYTALNDVTVRDLQRKDGQFTRGKGFDTFCPMGPAIATDLDPECFRLVTRKNGQQVQDSATDRFIFPVHELISFVSQVMTLYPGDVLSTGTPSGVGNLTPGDVIEVEIAGLPPLRNPVLAGPEFLGSRRPAA